MFDGCVRDTVHRNSLGRGTATKRSGNHSRHYPGCSAGLRQRVAGYVGRVSETIRTIGYLWFGGKPHYAISLPPAYSMTKWSNKSLQPTAACLSVSWRGGSLMSSFCRPRSLSGLGLSVVVEQRNTYE